MRFTLDNSALLRLLRPLRGLIHAENRLIPATGFLHFRLQAADGKDAVKSLAVKASNATVEISQQVDDAVVQDPGKGEALVSARKMGLICDNSDESTSFSFNCSDDLAEISSGHSKFELGALSPEQFPHMETNFNGGMDFSVRSADLLYLIKQTEYAMSKPGDPRDYLKGILLAVEGEDMIAVATDGHRLAHCSVKHKGGDSAPRRVVLPALAIRELKAMATSGEDETVSMLADERLVVAENDRMKITVKVYEEKKYPDYSRVMPGDLAYRAAVDSDEFRKALAKMKVVDSTLAVIELEKGALKIHSKSEQEKVHIEQAADYTGEKFTVGVNYEYLAQVFGVIESDKAVFEFKDANSAMLITEKDGNNAKHVVMPLRL